VIQGDTSLWEGFVQGVAAWNVFVLPVLLLAVAIARARAERAPGALRRVGRRLGLIHLGLAAWSLTRVVDELWAYRSMGIFPSNPLTGFAGSLLAIALDLPVGLGLRALRPWARRAALLLATFRLALTALVLFWTWSHGAVVDLTEWPRQALSVALPPFSLAALLWPGMKTIFHDHEAVDRPSRYSWIFSLVASLFLIALGTIVAADAVDWLLRAVSELAEGNPAS
jgi:hypothetical protein